MAALLLDIGNSRLKWGVLEDGDIRRTGHISQREIKEKGPGVLTSKLPHKVDVVRASNVAGTSFATRLSGVVGMHCNTDIHFARSEKRGWGVTNSYRQPRRLGVDRWVAMIGAFGEVQGACLVVDAGTALTLDAIDDDGVHLGGQIIPGAETMLNSLAAVTSDIPQVRTSTRRPADGIGMFAKNTAAAVREGAQNAGVGAIERAVRVLRREGHEPTTVLTGGGASRILDSLDEAPLHRPHLVLNGLAYMLESSQ